MGIDVTVMIGGEAGQGIQTVGDLLTRICYRSGLYLMAVNDFESRIRGGHSFMQMRISDSPVRGPDHRIHLLVALNEETYERHKEQMAEGGLVIIDRENGSAESNVLSVPITRLAREAGGKIVANTVTAGAALTLLGGPMEGLRQVLNEHFGDKKASVLENNLKAADAGRKAVEEIEFKWHLLP
ncbi:MAG: 2-oxoacid:acceptor oxidoreductase family protein, partial [Desulfobacterales bacterium]|nr:2-oxoacid:acceptor oxidoreductase family protein [Desulfobacterales bacterium]